MKAILMSIRPEWVAKILNGEKTIEIRKKFPKDYVGWVYIYVTKQGILAKIKNVWRYIKGKNYNPYFGYQGKVVARFWCDKVEEIKDSLCEDIFDYAIHPKQCVEKWQRIYKESCLTEIELSNYLKAKNGYAIHITKLKIFGKPKEIKEFYKVGCDEYFTKHVFVDHPNFRPIYERELKQFQFTRAPQSWCYVEI